MEDLKINDFRPLEVMVSISDNHSEINALLSLSDDAGNVYFSKNSFSGKQDLLTVSDRITTSDLLPGSYRLSVLATDCHDNKIRSTLQITIEDTGTTIFSGGLVSLHQNGTSAYATFLLNNLISRTTPQLADQAIFCANPSSGYVLIAPQGAGDARCFEPAEGNEIWSWPGTTGSLGGFTACQYSSNYFLLGEKSGFIRKFNTSGAPQGACSYFPGSYFPSKIFIHNNNILSVQKPVSSANPDKIVVFNSTSGQGLQEINLGFKVDDAIQSNDTLYLLTQSNPRQIWRYISTFNSIELSENTQINTSKAFISPVSPSRFLFTTDQGIYEIKPDLGWTNLLLTESDLQSAARSSSNASEIVFLKNNILKVVNKNTLNPVSQINLDAGAKDFILMNP